MPSRTDDAIVLARYPFRERDLVVALLTRQAGLSRALARRARGARSPLASALEPLALLRVTTFEWPQRELASLDEAEVVRSAFALASDPPAWAAGQVLAELALVFCPPGQRSEASFRLVDRCTEALLAGSDPLTVVRYAQLWSLRLSGVLPELDRCGVCGAELPDAARWFDPTERTLVCEEHRPAREPLRVSASAAGWLRRASREPVERLSVRPPLDAGAFLAAIQRRFTEKELASWPYFASLLAEC